MLFRSLLFTPPWFLFTHLSFGFLPSYPLPFIFFPDNSPSLSFLSTSSSIPTVPSSCLSILSFSFSNKPYTSTPPSHFCLLLCPLHQFYLSCGPSGLNLLRLVECMVCVFVCVYVCCRPCQPLLYGPAELSEEFLLFVNQSRESFTSHHTLAWGLLNMSVMLWSTDFQLSF